MKKKKRERGKCRGRGTILRQVEVAEEELAPLVLEEVLLVEGFRACRRLAA